MGKKRHQQPHKRVNKRYSISTNEIVGAIKRGIPLNPRMIERLNEDTLTTFIKDSIPQSILKQAKLSERDLIRDTYNLIVGIDKYAHMRERLIGNLAGVVGHVWATKYFKSKGYKVESEIPIFDKSTGRKVTATDLILTDKNGRQTYVEVKTAFKIGTEGDRIPEAKFDKMTKDYLEPGRIIPRSMMQSVRKETMSEVTTSTGSSAIRQMKTNKSYIESIDDGVERKVALCVYRGSEIYPEARKAIEGIGEIIVLPLDIFQLYGYCFNLVGSMVYYGRNLLKPPRGERRRTFEERYDIEPIDLSL